MPPAAEVGEPVLVQPKVEDDGAITPTPRGDSDVASVPSSPPPSSTEPMDDVEQSARLNLESSQAKIRNHGLSILASSR